MNYSDDIITYMSIYSTLKLFISTLQYICNNQEQISKEKTWNSEHGYKIFINFEGIAIHCFWERWLILRFLMGMWNAIRVIVQVNMTLDGGLWWNASAYIKYFI